ncbi:MAG: GC-type dockerin domain-anchored protein [Phycisphaerales bacterium JB040]
MRHAASSIVLAALTLAPAAHAQSVHVLDGTHETRSNDFEGRVLFIEYTNRSDRVQHATVTRLNDHFGLTAAHVAAAIKPGSSPTVGTGPDYQTDRGTTRTIIDWGFHPTWTGSFDGTAVDLGWVRFDQPLPGPPGFEIETIRGAGLGVDTTFVGYGQPATPDLGLLARDGQRRAFAAVTDEQGHPALGVSTDYARFIFYPLSIRNLPLAGVVTAGNSGSPGFKDLDSSLTHLAVANSGSPAYSSSSYALRLKNHEDWIVANTTPPQTCDPDVNGDGVLDNGDISAYVTLFLAADPVADFTGDGILDNGDIGAFVTAFLAGC